MASKTKRLYEKFTIEKLKREFGLLIEERDNFFADTSPVVMNPTLQTHLDLYTPLALANNTEKARSEFIVAPVMLEIFRLMNQTVSLFSGISFSVEPELGLTGVCDFLFSLSSDQLTLTAPIIVLVEAKNENTRRGLAQCIAEMVAAQRFNQKQQTSVHTIYGIVTTGNNWKFLRLIDTHVSIDVTEYHIREIDKVIGIILRMIKTAA